MVNSEIIEINATLKDLDLIDKIRKKHYSNDVVVPIELYSMILERQPICISLVINNGCVIGYYALIAIEEFYYGEMVQGKIKEKDLTDIKFIPIISKEKDLTGKYIYVLSLAAQDLQSHKLNYFLFQKLKLRLKYLKENIKINGIFTHYENEKLRNIFQNNSNIVNI